MSEEGNEITVLHRRGDPLEQLGRLNPATLLSNLVILGTPKASFQNPKSEDLTYIKERLKNTRTEGKVEAYLGHSPFFREMKRLFHKDRKANFFLRMGLGIPTTALGTIYGKLARRNFYNAYSETVHVYHPHKAIALHEIGHAIDYDKARFHGGKNLLAAVFPPARLKHEWTASRNAMKYLHKSEQQEAGTLLEPAFATYVGGSFLPFVGKLLSIPSGFISYAGALVAGHLHSRTSEKNIFFNGEPVYIKSNIPPNTVLPKP